jgi:hypothetical protein
MKRFRIVLVTLALSLLFGCSGPDSGQEPRVQEDPPLLFWFSQVNARMREMGFTPDQQGSRMQGDVYRVEMGFSQPELYLDAAAVRQFLLVLERDIIEIGNRIPEIRQRCGGEVTCANLETWLHVHKVESDIDCRCACNTGVLLERGLICLRGSSTHPFVSSVCVEARSDLDSSACEADLKHAWKGLLACSAELEALWQARKLQRLQHNVGAAG